MTALLILNYDVHDEPALAAYRERLEAHLGAIEAECRRLELPYAALDTGRPLAEVVLRRLVEAGVLVG